MKSKSQFDFTDKTAFRDPPKKRNTFGTSSMVRMGIDTDDWKS